MIKEFRDFIARGNVLDLAVAVIIGAAFATITTSLTDDIIMPVIGAFGSVDFSGLYCRLDNVQCVVGTAEEFERLKAEGVPILAWGQFATVVVNFLILAFVIFLIVRSANRLRAKEEEGSTGPSEIELLTEIRDELRTR